MAAYSNIVTDDSGYARPIPGVQVYTLNPDGTTAASADPQPATTDAYGKFTVEADDGVYELDYRVGGVSYHKETVNIGDPPQYIGPPGPSNNTRVNLAALKAAAISDGTSLYDRSLWTWETANAPYTADDVNTVKANSTALSVGAWVRQSPRRADLSAATGSSLVGFLQSGTGAVARTMQDKAGEIFSVKDFGANGLGLTSDTAAIQKAIDAACVAGGCVFFPTGRYLITSTLTVSSLYPVSLVGEMFGQIFDVSPVIDQVSAIVLGAAMTYAVKYVAPDSSARGYHGSGRISGLAFIDTPPANAGSPGPHTVTACLYLQDFALGVVENCTFHHIKGSAIKADYAVQSTIKGCRIRYCGDTANPTRSAILLAGTDSSYATQSFNLEDTRVEVCYSTAYISGSGAGVYDVSLRNCYFEAATVEYPASATTFVSFDLFGFVIDGCTFNRTLADAVIIGSNARGRIANSTWKNTAGAGASLHMYGAYCTIVCNIFEDNDTDKCINIEGSAVRTMMVGNQFYFSGGVYVGARGCKFNDNSVVNPTMSSGYWLTLGGDMATAQGNSFDDNGGTLNCNGIRSYGVDLVTSNHFDRWTGRTCIRRENANARIEGNLFNAVGTAYSEAVAQAAGVGPTINGAKVLSAPQPTVASPTGGTTQDDEARAAIDSLIALLEAHGLAV